MLRIEIWDGSSGKLDPRVENMITLLKKHVEIEQYYIALSLVGTRRRMLAQCRTKYLYMIDDDAVVTKSFLDVAPFNEGCAFICPRIIDPFYNGFQLFDFPPNKPLLPYPWRSSRVELPYMDTVAVLLDKKLCLDAGAFLGERSLGEFLDASRRIKEAGLKGLYEPRATVYHNEVSSAWKNPEITNKIPIFDFPEEFLPYVVPKRVAFCVDKGADMDTLDLLRKVVKWGNKLLLYSEQDRSVMIISFWKREFPTSTVVQGKPLDGGVDIWL